jgi:hypothetical protein
MTYFLYVERHGHKRCADLCAAITGAIDQTFDSNLSLTRSLAVWIANSKRMPLICF